MQKILIKAVKNGFLKWIDVELATMIANSDEHALMLAIAILSKYIGDGHVCLPLIELTKIKKFPIDLKNTSIPLDNINDWYYILSNTPAVGNSKSITPLILYNKKLYFNKMWHQEYIVAKFFIKNKYIKYNNKLLIKILDYIFLSKEKINWQKIAVAVAITRRISIITGGPGTGKTTTIAKLLASLIFLNKNNKFCICLAAPTGKAAVNLKKSIFSELINIKLTKLQLSYFPSEAITIHRLLGAELEKNSFYYNESNLLKLDVLVIDEASMIDLNMMFSLIKALPSHAKVIFLGDHNQLGPIESGAILNDICDFANIGYTYQRALELTKLTGLKIVGCKNKRTNMLCDSICVLNKQYRFLNNSTIAKFASAINHGELDNVYKILNYRYNNIVMYPLNNYKNYQFLLKNIIKEYNSFLNIVRKKDSPEKILDEFNKYQVLCALRDGPFGVTKLNYNFELMLLNKFKIDFNLHENQNWYEGRPVMILRNDSALELSNGDIGIALDYGYGIYVWFKTPNFKVKSIHPRCLPKHETAWVTTVHKSQGSQFDHVSIVLPNKILPLVNRRLIYTAVTRATKKISLYADKSILSKAILTKDIRYSGLREMMNQLSII